MIRSSHIRIAFLPGIAGAFVALLVGCAGGGAASQLSMRPAPILLSATGSDVAHYPADRPFGLATSPSSETPGIDGEASSDASSERDGTGSATANVAGGGMASAALQVGHTFKNDLDRQVDLYFKTRADFSFEVSADPLTSRKDAMVNVSIYARDNRNKLLQSLALLSHDSGAGAAKGDQSDKSEFRITLGPGQAVTVFLGADITIDAPESASANAAIRLARFEIDVRTQAAPGIQSNDD